MHDSYLSDKLAQQEQDDTDAVKMIEQYIDRYGVTFEIRAYDDNGDVLAKVSSNESAYDVSLSHLQIDNAIYELARQDQISRAEYLKDESENR